MTKEITAIEDVELIDVEVESEGEELVEIDEGDKRENTENIISCSLKNPTNQQLGAAFGGVKEAAIRARKKENPEKYIEMQRQYKMAFHPFIGYKDYNLEANTNHKPEDVLFRKIAGVFDRKTSNIALPTNLDEMLEAIQALREFKESNVISFSNFKGGVGKSLTATNIATTLAFFGCNVLIVDFDLQGNTTSMFDLYRYKKTSKVDEEEFRLEQLYDFAESDFKYTVTDLIAEAGKEKLNDMMKEAIINVNHKVNVIGRLDVLPNSCSFENVWKFENINMYLQQFGNPNKALDYVLNLVKDNYDFVIIDTPPSISLPLRMTVMASDYFSIVLTADKMARDGIAPFLKPIQMLGDVYRAEKKKDITILGGILNKYQEAINIHRDNKKVIEDTLQINTENTSFGEVTLFNQTVKNSISLTKAQYSSGSVLMNDPTEEIVKDYFNLAQEIIERIVIDKNKRNILRIGN